MNDLIKKYRDIHKTKHYDLVIFIDDYRLPEQVWLPNHSTLLHFKGYSDLQEYLSSIETNNNDVPNNVFISFDHYLDTDNGRFDGTDCLYLCEFFTSQLGHHIDIQGHSSDPDKNVEKLNIWHEMYE